MTPTGRTISAARLGSLVGEFDRHPAYAGLAASLRLLIGDGRIPYGTRLPSERELTGVLGLSRTTVTRAYADLRDRGYAEARQGSGTYTRVPGGRHRALDRTLSPRAGDDDAIDLSCAASSAPPGLAAAYEAAVAELPGYLSGHGYYPAGLPDLQRAVAAGYQARGLPTAPEQVMITPGALAATAITARALVRPGDRVLVESPCYPNAAHAFAGSGARLVSVPVDVDGWDVAGIHAVARRAAPRAAYLVPDFQNPTGLLMPEAQRTRIGRSLAAAGTTAVVDESLQALALDGRRMPPPLAAYVERAGGAAVTVGGASKMLWGGLRVGWLRGPRPLMEALTEARLTLDLGVPVLEQLVALRLLAAPEPVLAAHRERLLRQRDALAASLARLLPEWSFRLPAGGLTLWCRLPAPVSPAVAAAAEARGVAVGPGPLFAPEGGLASYLRIPFTRPVEELETAVDRLAEAWQEVLDSPAPAPGRPPVPGAAPGTSPAPGTGPGESDRTVMVA